MRSRRTWRLVTALVLAIAVAPVVSIGAAGRGVQGQPTVLTGALDGVPYQIKLPANWPASWNGTLLVYAHGYNETPPMPMLVPQAADEAVLLGEGYALAASRFGGLVPILVPSTTTPTAPDAGWVLKNAMQNIVALTTMFRDTVGHPQRTIMWGKSMGGVVALGVIEKYPGLIDGAVPLCAAAAGAPRIMDQRLDFTIAYAAAFGWDEAWGTPGTLRDDFNVVDGIYKDALKHLTETGRWEFIRLVSGIPYDASFYGPMNFRMNALWLSIVQRIDLDRRAGGRVAQNIGRVYNLEDDEKAYLLDKYGLDAEPLLGAMNARQWQYGADRNARNYAEHYVEPTGRITRPVLTLHTTGDAAATPDHEGLYFEAVKAEGRQDLLLQLFSSGNAAKVNTHCTFTPQQEIAAIHGMVDWLDTGIRPDPASFATVGLVPTLTVLRFPPQ